MNIFQVGCQNIYIEFIYKNIADDNQSAMFMLIFLYQQTGYNSFSS